MLLFVSNMRSAVFSAREPFTSVHRRREARKIYSKGVTDMPKDWLEDYWKYYFQELEEEQAEPSWDPDPAEWSAWENWDDLGLDVFDDPEP